MLERNKADLNEGIMRDMSDQTKLKLETHEVEVRDYNSDAGYIYMIICPNCGDHITWAKYAWWKSICSCGLKWYVEIQAKAYGGEND